MLKKCVKIKVLGKVQGVGYRTFIQKSAAKLSIEGTIRNESDGSVFMLAYGPSDKLDDLIDFVYKGSAKSKIEDVIVEPMIKEKDFRGVFRLIGESNA